MVTKAGGEAYSYTCDVSDHKSVVSVANKVSFIRRIFHYSAKSNCFLGIIIL